MKKNQLTTKDWLDSREKEREETARKNTLPLHNHNDLILSHEETEEEKKARAENEKFKEIVKIAAEKQKKLLK